MGHMGLERTTYTGFPQTTGGTGQADPLTLRGRSRRAGFGRPGIRKGSLRAGDGTMIVLGHWGGGSLVESLHTIVLRAQL